MARGSSSLPGRTQEAPLRRGFCRSEAICKRLQPDSSFDADGWPRCRWVGTRRGGNPRGAGVVRRVRRFRLGHLAQTRLWLVPLICVLAGIVLAVALLSVDGPVVGKGVTGSAASVQTILTVASTAL